MKLFPALWRATQYHYRIPSEYQDSFYLANASLFQIVNYTASCAYQAVFRELVGRLKSERPHADDDVVLNEVLNFIRSQERCDCFVDFNLPVRREDGSVSVVRGMRAYHGMSMRYNTALGGLRITENLQRHGVQGFALLSSYRHALLDMDVCGAHGGLRMLRESYEPSELKDAVQKFIGGLNQYRGHLDIIEPDLYCGSLEMQRISEMCGGNILAAGMSSYLKDSEVFNDAGPKAAISVLKTFLENERLMKLVGIEGGLKDKKFIIQGLGRLGSRLAKMLSSEGAVCVGVREHDCTFYDPSGIHVKALFKHIQKYDTMRNFSTKVKETTPDSLFGENCDLLVLAGVERAITCNIADNLKAKVVVEACNGPITPTADKTLSKLGKLVIPSLLCGGGQTLMSYLEHRQNYGKLPTFSDSTKKHDEVEELVNAFDTIVKHTTKEVIEIEREFELGLMFRKAAYIKAIRKMFKRYMDIQAIGQLTIRHNSQDLQ